MRGIKKQVIMGKCRCLVKKCDVVKIKRNTFRILICPRCGYWNGTMEDINTKK